MQKSWLIIGAVGAAMALPAGTHAQSDVCPQLNTLIEHIPTEFESLKGADLPRDEPDPDFATGKRATHSLPGAYLCTVRPLPSGKVGNSYTCSWDMGRNRADAAVAYERLASDVKACLHRQVWQDETERGADSRAGVEFRALFGRQFGRVSVYTSTLGRRNVVYLSVQSYRSR
jgi:hypothetical protein